MSKPIKRTREEQIAYLDGCIDTVTTLQNEIMKVISDHIDGIRMMVSMVDDDESEDLS